MQILRILTHLSFSRHYYKLCSLCGKGGRSDTLSRYHLPKCTAARCGEPAGYLKVDQLPRRNPEDAIMRLEMWGCTVPTPIKKLHRAKPAGEPK